MVARQKDEYNEFLLRNGLKIIKRPINLQAPGTQPLYFPSRTTTDSVKEAGDEQKTDDEKKVDDVKSADELSSLVDQLTVAETSNVNNKVMNSEDSDDEFFSMSEGEDE